MKRHTALIILSGFAVCAVLVTVWGVRDIHAWLAAMDRCEPSIDIDTSTFWLTGMLSIGVLPLLALLRSRQLHRIILAFLVVWFIAVPSISHHYVMTYGQSQGYDMNAAASVWQLNQVRVELLPDAC